MLLSVVHSTRYRYAERVARSTQYLRLTPTDGARQRVRNWQLDLPSPCVSLRDAFDNLTHVLTLDRPHDELQLVARGTVEVADADDGEPAGRLNPKVFLRGTRLTAADATMREFVVPFRGLVQSRPLIGVTELMNAVLDRMPWRKGVTQVDTTAAQAFALGGGVSQDHAHVFLALCRELGVPARYVSGYAFSEDRTEVTSHAWSEAWLGRRWVSFDVSHARRTGGAHIRLASGLDYLDACPVRGVRLGGGGEELCVTAQVVSGA